MTASRRMVTRLARSTPHHLSSAPAWTLMPPRFETEKSVAQEPKMPWPEMVEFANTHDLLGMRLYVISSKPTDGLGPILQNLEQHIAYQTELERKGIMFAAG